MILFFGPPGSGKSVQGQILAARHNWRWISAGQLLRDTHDIELLKIANEGNLVESSKIKELVGAALTRAKDIDHMILDGYPRQLDQAQWLVETLPQHERSVILVVVLNVPKNELKVRLKVRGRSDDETEAIEKRFKLYESETLPILEYLSKKNIPIKYIDGTGSVDQVHNRIEVEIKTFSDKI